MRHHAIARRSGELTGLAALTPREAEVARCLAAVQRDKVIARALGIAPGTVRSHVKRVLARLGVRCRDVGLLLAAEQLTGPK